MSEPFRDIEAEIRRLKINPRGLTYTFDEDGIAVGLSNIGENYKALVRDAEEAEEYAVFNLNRAIEAEQSYAEAEQWNERAFEMLQDTEKKYQLASAASDVMSDQLRARTTELEVAREYLGYVIATGEQKIAELEFKLATGDPEVAELEFKLATGDREVAQLTGQVQFLSDEVERLIGIQREKDEEVARLKELLERITEQEAQKDAEIERLEQLDEPWTRLNRGYLADKIDLKARNVALQGELDEKERVIDDLTRELGDALKADDSTGQIQALTDKLEERTKDYEEALGDLERFKEKDLSQSLADISPDFAIMLKDEPDKAARFMDTLSVFEKRSLAPPPPPVVPVVGQTQTLQSELVKKGGGLRKMTVDKARKELKKGGGADLASVLGRVITGTTNRGVPQGEAESEEEEEEWSDEEEEEEEVPLTLGQQTREQDELTRGAQTARQKGILAKITATTEREGTIGEQIEALKIRRETATSMVQKGKIDNEIRILQESPEFELEQQMRI